VVQELGNTEVLEILTVALGGRFANNGARGQPLINQATYFCLPEEEEE